MTRQARISITIALAAILVAGAPAARASDLWPGAFKSYEQIESEILAVEAAHPEIVDVFSIGHSYEGRELYAAKVSDNVALDEGEPEVLVDALLLCGVGIAVEVQDQVFVGDVCHASDSSAVRIFLTARKMLCFVALVFMPSAAPISSIECPW